MKEGCVIKAAFLKNAALLSATNVGLNLLGMVFRVYLSGKIGADGMGLYTLVLSVYFFAATLATSGLNLSVTRLVSEAPARRRVPESVLRRALILAVFVGTSAALMLFFSAEFVGARWLTDLRAVRPLKIFALGLPFVSASVCLGGYFLARRQIAAASKWQFFEQGVKICITMGLLQVFLPGGLEAACCGIIISLVIGEAVACGYGFLLYDEARKAAPPAEKPAPGEDANRGIYKDIGRISLPVAASSYFRAGLTTLENILIPMGFARRKGAGSGLAEFGVLKGMAMPVIVFPAAVLSSFTALLTPEISEANARGNREKIGRLCGLAIRGALIFSIFIVAVFLFFGEPLGVALYRDARTGAVIAQLAPVVLTMYLDAVADGLLRALGEQVASLAHNAVEGISRIALLYLLIPASGVSGFIFVVFISNLFSSFLGVWRLLVLTKLSLRPLDSMVKPAAAAGVSGFAASRLAAVFSMGPGGASAFGILFMGILYVFLLKAAGCRELEFYGKHARTFPG